MSLFQDLTGQTFGRFTAIQHMGCNEHGQSVWLWQCECGNIREITALRVKNGDPRSCGCVPHSKRTHGMSRTPMYRLWHGMIERCTKTNRHEYPLYGGRGIRVCDRWQKFENFLSDMGQRPSPNHSLDRIDNNEGYSLENCRWATRSEQARNTRSNRWVTYNGETLCVSEWAARIGIRPATLSRRIRLWTLTRALTMPAQVNQFR